ncbi:lipoyltransferase 1, mitochondrial-like [Anthonomus grandis grandis]|uniref:lipoyltransferase 1, mitochondrial-like n=1 Tax=Anthonomus grandis grandis TaxID=2921223 RepID=UPI002166775F|nr:lipoyltransferase 1, mitochondrial-like [Anthonomus grandis grandis]
MRHIKRLYCTHRHVAKSVCISKCTDIFTNLALEDWLYQNRDFTHSHLLMFWRNEPCVVIGRHQNPWLECNFAALPCIENGVKLARRNSGGGTVYHDLENLNLTFFTGRSEYSRRSNLEVISRSLKNSFNIETKINEREDLCIKQSKISGTASKLGRTSAYHHCTLLINSNKTNLSLALRNILDCEVKTNASVSVRSKIMNLSEVIPDVTVEGVMKAILLEYASKEIEIIEEIDENHFPGVGKIREMFESDSWRFLRTPKFTLFRNFSNGQVFMEIDKGIVTDLGVSVHVDDVSASFQHLLGKRFSKLVLDEFELVVEGLQHSKIGRISCNKSLK